MRGKREKEQGRDYKKNNLYAEVKLLLFFCRVLRQQAHSCALIFPWQVCSNYFVV